MKKVKIYEDEMKDKNDDLVRCQFECKKLLERISKMNEMRGKQDADRKKEEAERKKDEKLNAEIRKDENNLLGGGLNAKNPRNTNSVPPETITLNPSPKNYGTGTTNNVGKNQFNFSIFFSKIFFEFLFRKLFKFFRIFYVSSQKSIKIFSVIQIPLRIKLHPPKNYQF